MVGTSPEAIDLAEDRGRSARAAPGRAARPPTRHGVVGGRGAVEIARDIGYPVLVRPSYVLGGAGMRDRVRRRHPARVRHRGGDGGQPEHPVLVDRFLDDAIEIDVDASTTGSTCTSAG
jgi:carbamoyl-phosphate synthase large subunit